MEIIKWTKKEVALKKADLLVAILIYIFVNEKLCIFYLIIVKVWGLKFQFNKRLDKDLKSSPRIISVFIPDICSRKYRPPVFRIVVEILVIYQRAVFSVE